MASQCPKIVRSALHSNRAWTTFLGLPRPRGCGDKYLTCYTASRQVDPIIVLAGVARALVRLHDLGIVHRDLKVGFVPCMLSLTSRTCR